MMNLELPLFANENGDVSVFATVDAMSSHVEAIDIENGEYEFFDASGQRIDASVTNGHVVFASGLGPPEPERLADVLRGYFSHLPPHLQAFERRASAAITLRDLVALREELETVRRPSRLRRLFRGSA